MKWNITNRWLVATLAFIGILINYFDRSALSFAIKPLQEYFHLNDTQFGIIASAFSLGYIIMVIFSGQLIDYFGSRKVWSIGGIFWSVFMMLLGFATGFWWLYIFRLLLGMAETVCFPGLTRMIADWFPGTERASSLGFSLAAVPFASVIGSPFIATLVVDMGWRFTFILLGCLGLVWALLWGILFRDKPKDAVVSAEQMVAPKTAAAEWKKILLHPVLLSNNYAFFAFGYTLYFGITWLPGYFEQAYGIQLKEIGWLLISPWLLATILILMGGFLCDYIFKKTHSIRAARSHIIWISQILSALCFLPIVFIHSLSVAIIFMTLAIGIGMMPNAAFYAINIDLMANRAATSLAVMVFAFGIAGLMVTSLTGFLTTLTGSFDAAIWLMIFFSVTATLGVIIFQREKYFDES
jgi:ACS family hexuronate transporter-like MFS transporter